MTSTQRSLYDQYLQQTRQAADLNGAAALLQWDQEVYMPAKGARFRARQLATLAEAAHELLTADTYGHLLQELAAAALPEEEAANIRLSLEDFEKNKKLPAALVVALSMATSQAFEAWIAARRQNDFSLFLPLLQQIIDLKKEQAARYGYQGHPYDALLDDYEKDASVARLDPLFATVREKLPPLLAAIAAGPQVSDALLRQHFPAGQQFAVSKQILAAMGFDFEAGRQDYSEHPFTTSFSPEDVRVTTRADENDLANLLWSSIHEGGHALYEQGLPVAQYGLPLGQPASLSIHESQSRFWENNVGRSLEFMHYLLPLLAQSFPKQMQGGSPEALFRAANQVKPSLIRTEADELTYHFHVLIRYELEKELISGALQVADLPHAWDEGYQKYLGIRPGNIKEGVLQDVHWSHGSFGYFPTYSLGSFYAAQFSQKLEHEIPGLKENIRTGAFAGINAWLHAHVFQYGRRYRSEELCRKATGSGLSLEPFLAAAQQKYGAVYNLKP